MKLVDGAVEDGIVGSHPDVVVEVGLQRRKHLRWDVKDSLARRGRRFFDHDVVLDRAVIG